MCSYAAFNKTFEISIYIIDDLYLNGLFQRGYFLLLGLVCDIGFILA